MDKISEEKTVDIYLSWIVKIKGTLVSDPGCLFCFGDCVEGLEEGGVNFGRQCGECIREFLGGFSVDVKGCESGKFKEFA